MTGSWLFGAGSACGQCPGSGSTRLTQWTLPLQCCQWKRTARFTATSAFFAGSCRPAPDRSFEGKPECCCSIGEGSHEFPVTANGVPGPFVLVSFLDGDPVVPSDEPLRHPRSCAPPDQIQLPALRHLRGGPSANNTRRSEEPRPLVNCGRRGVRRLQLKGSLSATSNGGCPQVPKDPRSVAGQGASLRTGLRSARNHSLPDGCLLPAGVLLKLGEDFQDKFPHGASVNA
jgi:hypothetical protein